MKNPLMSMWLSAANRAAGQARGLWSAEAARQQQAFVKSMTQAMMPKAPAAKKSARRLVEVGQGRSTRPAPHLRG